MTRPGRRFWFMFSLALNLGFIVTALVLFLTHPPSRHDRHMKYVETALMSVTLTEAERTQVLEEIHKFDNEIKEMKGFFHQARHNSLNLLAQPGPLDRNRYQAINDEIKALVGRMHRSIGVHLINVREMLGPEKGPVFFRVLLEQTEQSRDLR